MTRNVTVFGGTGFIGRHIVQRLARAGDSVRVAVRHPGSAGFLKPLGNVGQVVPVQANVRDEASVAAAVAGADAVINLVGLLYQSGRQSFAELQARAPGRIARAAAEAGVSQLVHVSAIGADRASPSAYGRSKAAGEAAVREAFPQATILRPSIVFGPEDDFFNRFAALCRTSPLVPLFFDARKLPRFHWDGVFLVPSIEAGTSRMQPVYVGDVADAALAVLARPDAQGGLYELGGPADYSFRDLMALIQQQLGVDKPYLPVPYAAVDAGAFFAQMLPVPPITRDQLKMLRIDNVVADDAATLKSLGIAPTAVEVILPTYLARHAAPRAAHDEAPQA